MHVHEHDLGRFERLDLAFEKGNLTQKLFWYYEFIIYWFHDVGCTSSEVLGARRPNSTRPCSHLVPATFSRFEHLRLNHCTTSKLPGNQRRTSMVWAVSESSES